LDRLQHQVVLDAGNDGDFANPGGQYEVHFALNRFLIAAKACGQAFRLDALDGWNRTVFVDDAMNGSGLSTPNRPVLSASMVAACIPQAMAAVQESSSFPSSDDRAYGRI
jgi:hypothetical protein